MLLRCLIALSLFRVIFILTASKVRFEVSYPLIKSACARMVIAT